MKTTAPPSSISIRKKLLATSLALLTVGVLSACAGGSRSPLRAPVGQRSPAPAPAMIGHIVFIELENPSDYHRILRDSDWMLGTISTVTTYAAGRHLDTGRSSVRGDYDLAIYLGFENESGLRAYVDNPQHIEFVNKWKPKLISLRVYDMIDWPTTRYGVHPTE